MIKRIQKMSSGGISVKLIKAAVVIQILAVILAGQIAAQSVTITDNKADEIVPGAEMVVMNHGVSIPSFIKFRQGSEIEFETWNSWMKNQFVLAPEINFSLTKVETDAQGLTHYRYNQSWQGYQVFGNELVLHVEAGKVASISGHIRENFIVQSQIVFSEVQALNRALQTIAAQKYQWELPEEEMLLQQELGDTSASWLPHAELTIVPDSGNFSGENRRLAYKFDVYAHQPLSRNYVFVDAADGKILMKVNRIWMEHENVKTNAIGTASTKYSGSRSITTDLFNNNQYRLRETGRGLGIETYDMNMGTSYSGAVDFTDADNIWNNVNAQKDEVATDVHWGAEKTYDYFFTKYNRNSIDNAGLKLKNYVHTNLVAMGFPDNANAFWDGSRMSYGDGNGTCDPFTALDIVGHEISHGVIQYTARLNATSEALALNEGFADIFATCVEAFSKSGNWTMGEDICSPIRDLSDPNSLAFPDTYLGNYWDFSGEAHVNSCPLGYWFYLLSMGGAGTNDLNNNYNITGITIDTAAIISYNTLYYLTSTSTYDDCRAASLMVCNTLYGPCSKKYEQCANAWYAVGVGPAYSALPANLTATALPNILNFGTALSLTSSVTGATSWSWSGPGGYTSTAQNPMFSVYTTSRAGIYTCVASNSCGAKTAATAAVIVNPMAQICSFTLGNASVCIADTVVIPIQFTGLNQPDAGEISMQIQISDTGIVRYLGCAGLNPSISGANLTVHKSNNGIVDTISIRWLNPGSCNFSAASGTLLNLRFYCKNKGNVNLRFLAGSQTKVIDCSSNFPYAVNWTDASLAINGPITQYSASVSSNPACTGDSVRLTALAAGATTWNWYGPGGYTSTVQNPVIRNLTTSMSGIYTLTAQNYCGGNIVLTQALTIINDNCIIQPWLGFTGNWSSPANWLGGQLPDPNTDVVISSSANNPVINGFAECRNLIINPGATLTILPGQSLTVYGTTTLNGPQCLVIKSNSSGTGSFIDNGTINGMGSAKIERYISGNVWHYISAPVTIATASVFNGQYLKSWNENNYSWANVSSPATPFTSLKGYALKSLSSTTYSFSSKPNTGSHQLMLTRNSNLPLSKQGWCLIGNPFPSAIDWDAPMGWNKNNVDNAVYIYNQSYSNYAVYNNGIGVNGGSRYIPAEQGFFITCNNNSGGIIQLDNQVRLHNNTGYLKTEGELDYIRLTLQDEGWRDEIIVRICQQSSAMFDGQFDAYKFMDGGLSQLWTENMNSSSVQYAINTLPDVQNNSDIPVVFKPARNGAFTITASEFEHLFQLTGIFLEDLKTGITTNLGDTPEYNFTADTADDIYRFVLHFEAGVITGNQPAQSMEPTVSTVVPNPNNGVFTVVPGNRINEQYYISIANADGRIIYNSSKALVGNHRIFAGKLRRGLHYLKLKTSTRAEIVKFIVAE